MIWLCWKSWSSDGPLPPLFATTWVDDSGPSDLGQLPILRASSRLLTCGTAVSYQLITAPARYAANRFEVPA